MEFNTVLLIGKPGSGKGTQAKFLCEKTGWPVISSGDLFRALAKEESPAGKRLKEETERGLLAPDWFAMYLFQKSALGLDPNAGIVFDGFGRKAPEAEVVISVLNWLGRPFTALHIKVSDEDVRKRLQLRSEVSGRVDDHAIDERLSEYNIYTEPAIDVFRKAGKLIEIDGSPSPEVISEDIGKSLGLA